MNCVSATSALSCRSSRVSRVMPANAPSTRARLFALRSSVRSDAARPSNVRRWTAVRMLPLRSSVRSAVQFANVPSATDSISLFSKRSSVAPPSGATAAASSDVSRFSLMSSDRVDGGRRRGTAARSAAEHDTAAPTQRQRDGQAAVAAAAAAAAHAHSTSAATAWQVASRTHRMAPAALLRHGVLAAIRRPHGHVGGRTRTQCHNAHMTIFTCTVYLLSW